MNKANGSDGIPVELFQILKDNAVKVLHSICQQIWKTLQWPQDWKFSVFIPILKKGSAKECSNQCTIALMSHASKIMLKILQGKLQQYVNHESPDVQDGFYFLYKLIYFNWRLITLQYCIGFAIHKHESATGIHVFPILKPAPSSLPVPSLWVVSVHQHQASSIMH